MGLAHGISGTKAKADSASSLGFQSENYSITDTGSGRPSNIPSIFGRFQGSARKKLFDSKADIEAGIGVQDRNYRYINVPELYAGIATEDNQYRGYFGRKKYNWNSIDDEWQLGVFEPRFRWNYLNPNSVGLTGFFFDYEKEWVQSTVFGSPLYIPEMGATVEENDGKLTSSNPFFSAPPDSLPVFGQNTPVRYRINTPKAQDIVFHPSAGMTTRFGAKEGVWSRGSYAYKPMNQVLMNYDGYFDLNSNQVNVTIEPRVAYHHVGVLETGFTRKGTRPWDAWLSVMGDRPVDTPIPDGQSFQQVKPAVSASSNVGMDVWGKGDLAGRVSLSYLHTWGGFANDQGPLAAGTTSLFESRYPYSSAFSVKLRTPLMFDHKQNLSLTSRVVYDFGVNGTLISTDLRYKTSKHWQFGLGTDLIGATKERASGGGADYLYRYQANDRIRGAVGYVF